MTNLNKSIVVLAVAMAALVAVMTFSMPVDAAEEQEYDQDMGVLYGYTLQFVFTGSDASSVTWDFGDGSEPVTAWNPQHTYSEKGVYYVTQDAYNTYDPDGDGEGSHSIAVYRIEIAGYPWITFVSNGGSEVETITMTSGGKSAQAATEPEEPVREDYEFAGWYTDASLTVPYDWSSLVTEPVTLYAGWEYVGTADVFTVTFDTAGGTVIAQQQVVSGQSAVEPADPAMDGFEFAGWYLGDTEYDFGAAVTGNITLVAHWTESSADDEDNGFPLWIVVAIVAAILALATLVTRNWMLGMAAVLVALVAALLYTGVI